MIDEDSETNAAAKPRDSALALIAANSVPLLGVVLWDWSVSSVLILYWFENVVIGVLNVVKMVTSATSGGPRELKVFLVPFFIVHYFAFCGAHGIFLFALFGDTDGYFTTSSDLNLLAALGRAVEIFWTPLALAAAALSLSHVYSLVINYFMVGEYRRIGLRRLMSAPYSRVVVLHITIITGGFITTMLASPVWLIVILVLVKTAVDLRMHLAEHRSPAASG
jgi:hypothetical protein